MTTVVQPSTHTPSRPARRSTVEVATATFTDAPCQKWPAFEVSLSWPDSTLMQNRMGGRHWTYAHEAKTHQRQEAYL